MNNDEIGNYIAKCRKEKGITQQQLADILCISNKTVSKWETNQGMPDTSILVALAKSLDTSVDSILNGVALNQPKTESQYASINQSNTDSLYVSHKWEEINHLESDPLRINYKNDTTNFMVNKSIYRFKSLRIFSLFFSLIGDVAFFAVLGEGEIITAFCIGLWFNLIGIAILFYYYNITKREVELYNACAVEKIQFIELRNHFLKPNLYFVGISVFFISIFTSLHILK